MTTIKKNSIVLPGGPGYADLYELSAGQDRLQVQLPNGDQAPASITLSEAAYLKRGAGIIGAPYTEVGEALTMDGDSPFFQKVKWSAGTPSLGQVRYDENLAPMYPVSGSINVYSNSASSSGKVVKAPNGRLYLCNFPLPDGADMAVQSSIICINPDFTIDVENSPYRPWMATLSSTRYTFVHFLDDGKFVVAYNNTTWHDGSPSDGYLARYNPDGTLDNTFTRAVFSSYITDGAVLPDGRYVFIGNFQTIDGATRKRIAIINADGTLGATTFGTGFSMVPTSVTVSPTGYIIVYAGNLTMNYQSTTLRQLWRIDTDGVLDTNYNIFGGLFAVPAALYIKASLCDNGEVFVYIAGGSSTLVINPEDEDHKLIFRIKEDGSFDQTFKFDYSRLSFSPEVTGTSAEYVSTGPFLGIYPLDSGNYLVYRKNPATPYDPYYAMYYDNVMLSGHFVLSPTGELLKDLDFWGSEAAAGYRTPDSYGSLVPMGGDSFIATENTPIQGRFTTVITVEPTLQEGVPYVLAHTREFLDRNVYVVSSGGINGSYTLHSIYYTGVMELRFVNGIVLISQPFNYNV